MPSADRSIWSPRPPVSNQRIDIGGMGGYTHIQNGRGMDLLDGTIGERFGPNKRWGVLLGGSYDYNSRGIDDIEPAPDPASRTPLYDSMDIREYAYNRTRYGFAGSTDYKLGDGSSIYLRGLFSRFEDYGEKWVYTLNNYVPPPTAMKAALPTMRLPVPRRRQTRFCLVLAGVEFCRLAIQPDGGRRKSRGGLRSADQQHAQFA